MRKWRKKGRLRMWVKPTHRTWKTRAMGKSRCASIPSGEIFIKHRDYVYLKGASTPNVRESKPSCHIPVSVLAGDDSQAQQLSCSS